MDDIKLLREFAGRNSQDSQDSQEAFRLLVERHVDFVYSVARRQLKDAQLAQEVTQSVFIDLAAKAARIPSRTILSGWLFRATRFAAAKAVRSEMRRQRREQEAAQMESNEREPEPWDQMEPMLNEALEELSDQDRSAVLLRFFEKKGLREIGKRLGLNEDAAKKRVARAVEKLRLIFQRRGVVLPTAIFLGALTAQSTQAAAPVGLASTIASAVAIQGAPLTATACAFTSGKTILKLMALSKIKAVAVAVVALLAVGGATNLVIQHNRSPAGGRPSLTDQDEAAILRLIESMNARALSTAPPYVYVRPTRTPGEHHGAITMNGRIMGRGVRIEQLLAAAYGTSESRVRPKPGVSLPTERYSYVISLNSGQQEALQNTLREQLGLTARLVKRTEPVYLLKSRVGQFGGRNPAPKPAQPTSASVTGNYFSKAQP
jgi:RNA polymerase sigma factor (sigma-70 family)